MTFKKKIFNKKMINNEIMIHKGIWKPSRKSTNAGDSSAFPQSKE